MWGPLEAHLCRGRHPGREDTSPRSVVCFTASSKQQTQRLWLFLGPLVPPARPALGAAPPVTQ